MCDYQVKAEVACDWMIQAKTVSAGNICLAQCNNRTVQFLNKSIGAKAQFWDFGETNNFADTSSDKEPMFTYSDTGSYKVKLIAIGENCTDTLVSVVNIYDDQVQANFDITGKYCVGDTMLFRFAHFFTWSSIKMDMGLCEQY